MAVPIRKIPPSLEGDMIQPPLSSEGTPGTPEAAMLAREAGAYYTFPPEPDAHGSVEYKLFLDPSPRREQRLVTQLLWRLGQNAPQIVEGKEAQVATYMLGVLDDGACIGVTPARMATSLDCLSRMAKSLSSPQSVIPAVTDSNQHISARDVGIRIVRAMAIRKDHVPHWSRHRSPVMDLNEEDEDTVQILSEDVLCALLPTSVRIDLQPNLWPDLARTRARSSSRPNGPDLKTMRAVVAAQQRGQLSQLPPEETDDLPSLPDESKLNKKRQAARARRLRRKIDMIRREREGMGIFDHSELEAALGMPPQEEVNSLPDELTFDFPHSFDFEDKSSDPFAEDTIVAAIPTPAQGEDEEEEDPGFAFSFDLDDPVDSGAPAQTHIRTQSTQSSDKSDLDAELNERASSAPSRTDTWLPQEDNCRIVLEVQVIGRLT